MVKMVLAKMDRVKVASINIVEPIFLSVIFRMVLAENFARNRTF